jgi:hypothetical protein
MKTSEKTENLFIALSQFCNSFNPDTEGLINEFKNEHRTIQQSFTKFCLKWIEFVGSDDYKFDLRNEQSHEVCKKILNEFKKTNDNFNPSDFLSMI